MSTALVIDDHPAIHVGCQQMLAEQFQTVLAASDGPEGLALATAHQPGLILLDLALREVWGLDLVAPLKVASPSARILIFSMNDKPVFAAHALQRGAQGFLSKEALPAEFRKAIRAVLADDIYLDDAMARRVALLNAAPAPKPAPVLNARERQMLQILAQGGDLRAVAEGLSVSYKTAANLSALLKRKLSVQTLADLIRVGLREELG
ncbi:response regulator transcription factor (plasmid) [Gemmobacter fulvus]|uniref:Response regulator transcription factor n=1 Tax=Gemmobacter fulvus TaxID=2840474 RepID=A0A975P9A6_9RHOB|nr:response regulator transcription factor [Gemmobacter fulvus]MBT9246019.1 response regulator transcription factor [Gemmobacter fulvus]MDQ1850401.1 response regulator transcription factor [Gemmobacter fulvus]QWK92215.1 response regulator transcription factor [Gemmobacter fulvus]